MLSENRRSNAHVDWVLIALTFVLSLFGVLAISVATYNTNSDPTASILNQIVGSYYSMRQAIFLFIAPIVVIVMMVVPNGMLKRRAELFYYASIFLLIVVAITNGAEGVKAWVDILWGYTIQPSEFAKITLILMLAKSLSKTDRPMSNMREAMKIMMIIAWPALAIMAQGEMGTLIVMIFIFAVMLYFSNVSMKLLASFVAIGVIGIAAIYFFAVASGSDNYRLNRILAFFNPELYSQNDAYQQTQSMIAIGSGGLHGVGMYVDGAIYQLDYVPADWTDFIFSSIGEAYGFVGCIAIVGTYLLMILRMLYLAAYTKDRFGQLVIVGVMAMFLYHVFQNVAMTIGLMPITGIPLPFLSYGGSNMVSNMACIGIVLNVTKNRSLAQSFETPQTSLRGRYFGEA